MIDVLDRREVRGFVHKKILGAVAKFAAGTVPGGSTALGLVSSLVGGGGGAPASSVLSAIPAQLLGGGGLSGAVRRQATALTAAPTPSIPPVNPVRTRVILNKPIDPLKLAMGRTMKRRLAQDRPGGPPIGAGISSNRPVATPAATAFPSAFSLAAPSFSPSLASPSAFAGGPAVGAPMPIHSRVRDAVTNFFAPAVPTTCIWPARIDPLTGQCRIFAGEQSGPENVQTGGAVMGRYGAAYVPGSRIINRAVCLAGDVVGNDGLCYPRRSIKNSDREWPRGRRPLLTGGDMRAISIAHRAGARMTRAAGRLQDMGIIKKPIVRKQIRKKC